MPRGRRSPLIPTLFLEAEGVSRVWAPAGSPAARSLGHVILGQVKLVPTPKGLGTVAALSPNPSWWERGITSVEHRPDPRLHAAWAT